MINEPFCWRQQYLPEPLPEQQGLKHPTCSITTPSVSLPEPLPEQQGLKLSVPNPESGDPWTSGTTSRTTRIETSNIRHQLLDFINLPEPLPEQQGLKLSAFKKSSAENILPEPLPEQQGLKHDLIKINKAARCLPEPLPEQQGLKLVCLA